MRSWTRKAVTLVLFLAILALFFPLTLFIPVPAVSATGGSWSPITSGTSNQLVDVWGSSASDFFAVGADGTILHYNGSAWSPMTSGTSEDLYAVWGNSAINVFAVGLHGTIMHYNGSAWSPMESGTSEDNLGVSGATRPPTFSPWGILVPSCTTTAAAGASWVAAHQTLLMASGATRPPTSSLWEEHMAQ